MEDFAIFHTAARRGNDLCGELSDVVAEFGAKEGLFGEGKLYAAADAEHGLQCLGPGEETVLFERLIRGFLTGAAEDLHTTSGGGEELDLAAVPGGLEDQVIVDDMGHAGESGFGAATLEAQVAWEVSVADLAADVFVLGEADIPAEGGAVLKTRGGGAGSAS